MRDVRVGPVNVREVGVGPVGMRDVKFAEDLVTNHAEAAARGVLEEFPGLVREVLHLCENVLEPAHDLGPDRVPELAHDLAEDVVVHGEARGGNLKLVAPDLRLGAEAKCRGRAADGGTACGIHGFIVGVGLVGVGPVGVGLVDVGADDVSVGFSATPLVGGRVLVAVCVPSTDDVCVWGMGRGGFVIVFVPAI